MAATDVLTTDEAKACLNLGARDDRDDLIAAYNTAASTLLDELVGPVVQRTVTSEPHVGGCAVIRLRYWPVATVTTVTESVAGVETELTAEDLDTWPAAGYLTEPYSHDPTLLGPRLRRRTGGGDTLFASDNGRANVLVTYDAGRFEGTSAVTEHYKAAARLLLVNAWGAQQHGAAAVGEFDQPSLSFPRSAVTQAVLDHLAGELQRTKTNAGAPF